MESKLLLQPGFIKVAGVRKPIAERFWSKVDKRGASGCWLWTASRAGGYGQLGMFKQSPIRAHRWAWEQANGRPVPVGLGVLHRCDVCHCVNPAHLFLGTPADNTRDMIAKGRSRHLAGEAAPSAKLNRTKVSVIRFLAARTSLASTDIARLFCVTHQAIGAVLTKRTWRGVEMISF